MSLQQTINFDTPGNFTFDSNKIEIDSGKAQLLLRTAQSSFPLPFTSDAGFTYDSAKAEFDGTMLKNKPVVVANEIFYVPVLIDANALRSIGSPTATAQSGATVSTFNLKKYLDLTYGVGSRFEFDAANADFMNQGTIRFKYVPKYSGTPSTSQFLFDIYGSGYANRIFLQHGSGSLAGKLEMRIYRSDGGLQSALTFGGASWNPTANQEYEFEIDLDFSGAAQRLFIDGVQWGVQGNSSISRTSINYFSIATPTSTSKFLMRDLQVFSNIQHTANFSGEIPRTIKNFQQSNIISPELSHTGLGTLISFDSFAATDTNEPRYTLQIGRSGDYLYWNGSAWAVSDGSYAQATDRTTFNANVGSLDVDGQIYGQYKIHFDETLFQQSVELITSTLTENDGYYQDNPKIINASGVFADSLDGFSVSKNEPGSDQVKFQIKLGTAVYYHNGTAWVVGTEGDINHSNTESEIEANKSSLDMTGGETLKIVALLSSADGTTTPDITQIVLNYGFQAATPNVPDECFIYGFLKDIVGEAKSGTLIIENKENIQSGGNLIIPNKQKIDFDSNGYVEISLVETETVFKKFKFSIEYTDIDGNTRITKLGEATVPNQESENLSNLTFE